MKKKIWKKWWFWVIVILFLGGLGRTGNKENQVATTSTKESTQETDGSANTETQEESSVASTIDSEIDSVKENEPKEDAKGEDIVTEKKDTEENDAYTEKETKKEKKKSKKTSKAKKKKKSKENESENEESHIYDRAQVKDMLNGFRTEKLGEYSVIYADSSECTDDVIVDWYMNYVSVNDFNYSFIIYTDKKGYGIYEMQGFIEIGVGIEKDEYGDYSYGSNSDSRMITIDDGGNIVELNDED